MKNREMETEKIVPSGTKYW